MAHNQGSFTLTKQERRQLEKLAKDADLSFSNYVRQCCGLEPLQHGGKRNTRLRTGRRCQCCKPRLDTKTLRQPRGSMNDPYTKFREDGWPLCPNCGEDELWSKVMLAWIGQGDRPTIDECVKGEMTCYRCNWNSWKAKLQGVLSSLESR